MTTLEHGPFAVMAGAPWNVLDSRGCLASAPPSVEGVEVRG